jgi:glycosyltransferase involved in cell wall biosynthesis
MKVLHFSVSDFGGAGTAAFRLHQALLAEGVDSSLLVTNRSRTESERVFVAPFLNRMAYKLLSRITDRWVKGSARSSARARYFYSDFNHSLLSASSIEQLGLKPDVIVAHSSAGFVSAARLAKMSAAWGVPLVWYLMDMGSLTGGCHFAFDCEAYFRQCGLCPALQSDKENDWSRHFWAERRHAAQVSAGVVVAPNQWLARQARQSGVFSGSPLHTIELSIDLERYRPDDRRSARRALGLPEDGRYIFFGAHYADEERKGVHYLIEALNLLHQRLEGSGLGQMPTIITAGSALAATSLQLPFPHFHLGLLDAETRLPLAYQAADVFVSPAIEDSGPMMILESLACGTPVAAFDMGVAKDVLVEGETGYVARLKDASDLAEGIGRILLEDTLAAQKMSNACRELAEARLAPRVQAQAFAKLFSFLKLEPTSHA